MENAATSVTAGYSSSEFLVGETSLTSNCTTVYCWPNYELPNAKSKIQRDLIESIMEGEIELPSLVDSGVTEKYEIEDISFKGKKTKFTCVKEVDLDYVRNLRSNSQLLLEFSETGEVDHKRIAVNHSGGDGSISIITGLAGTSTTLGNIYVYTTMPNTVTFDTTLTATASMSNFA